MEKEVFLSVQSAYDRWSKSYDDYDNPMVFAAGQVIATNLGDLSGVSLFEFGCGTGRNLAQIKALGAKTLSGCDFSEGMLEVGRNRDQTFQTFQHDMNLRSDVSSASIDVALFCLTLEHIEDLQFPLQEAKRIVRPSGRIEIIEIHPFVSMGGVAAHFKDNGEEVHMPTYPHQFADYLKAFRDLSLSVIRCREWRPIDFGMNIPSKTLKRGIEFPIVVQFTCGIA